MRGHYRPKTDPRSVSGQPVTAERLRAIDRAEVLYAKDDLLICKWHRRNNESVGIRHSSSTLVMESII